MSWAALALAWDGYFFVVHRAFHLNKHLYRLFHKTHHTYKVGATAWQQLCVVPSSSLIVLSVFVLFILKHLSTLACCQHFSRYLLVCRLYIQDPNCFTAYYVSYCSHLITEQAFVIAAALICPSDVLIHYLYYGTIGTYLNHSGYELTQVKLPFVGLSIGREKD